MSNATFLNKYLSVNSFLDAVKAEFQETYPLVPISRNKLIDEVNDKARFLEKHYNIKVTKKTLNKAIDFLCGFKYGIEDGYQTHKALATKIIERLGRSFLKAQDLPETLILTVDHEESLYYLKDVAVKEFLLDKRNTSMLTEGLSNPEDNSKWIRLDNDLYDIVKDTYFCYVIDSTFNPNNTETFGSEHNDINYVSSYLGLKTIDSRDLKYNSVFGTDDSLIMRVQRPSDLNVILSEIISYIFSDSSFEIKNNDSNDVILAKIKKNIDIKKSIENRYDELGIEWSDLEINDELNKFLNSGRNFLQKLDKDTLSEVRKYFNQPCNIHVVAYVSHDDFQHGNEYLINEDPFIFYNDAKKFILRTLNDYKDFKYITFKTHDAENFIDFQIFKDAKGNCYIDSPLIDNEYF